MKMESSPFTITIRLGFFLLFLCSMPVDAKIKTEKDKFDGHVTVSSSFGDNWSHPVGPFGSVTAFKDGDGLGVLLMKVESDWWFFSTKDTEIKVNGIIYNAPIKVMSKNLIDRYCSTAAYVYINKDLLSRILASKSVVFRVHFDNQSSIVWDVPVKILTEWRDLATGKFK